MMNTTKDEGQSAEAGHVERGVMQHTRDGPWIDAGLTGPNPRLTGGPLRLVKCEGVVIAFLPAWLDDEHEEARANARLVAAAPELLKCLRSLYSAPMGQGDYAAAGELLKRLGAA